MSGTAGKLVSKAVFEASFFYIFLLFSQKIKKKGVCIEDARQCGREAKEKNIFTENKEKGSMTQARRCAAERQKEIFSQKIKKKGVCIEAARCAAKRRKEN